ncbi:hypothetical protein [Mycobacterium sp.]
MGRGEVELNRSPANVVAGMVGPLFYRRWFSREPIDDTFNEAILRYL